MHALSFFFFSFLNMIPSGIDLPLPIQPLLRYESNYHALICLTCNNGYTRKSIVRHLNSHGIKSNEYGPILKSFERESLANDWTDLHIPSNGSTPIEGLKLRTGWVC